MNLFTRVSNLMTVNLHALLDWAENPERMLTQLVRDMEEALDATRQHAATTIAAERGLRRDLEHHRAAAQEWTHRARLALSQHRDDLARGALARKIEHEDQVKSLEGQHLAAEQLSQDVKAALRNLQHRLSEARSRLSLLRARRHAAQVRLEVGQTLTQDVAGDDTAFARLASRMVAVEDQLLAEAELHEDANDLRTEFGRLAMSMRIEEELETLKRELPRCAE